MTGSPLAMPIRVMQRWKQRMSGVELSILFVLTAIALGMLPDRSAVTTLVPVLPSHPVFPLWKDFGLTFVHFFLSIGVVVTASMMLAGAASQWPRFRQILVPGLSVGRAIPGLGLIGLLAPFCSPVVTIMLVGASSMIWRVTTAILDAEDSLPAELEAVSLSLRMTGWQRFWRLLMPLAVPMSAYRAAQAIPGLWVRILSAEGLLMLLTHHDVGGCGTLALTGMMQDRPTWVFEAAAVILLLVFAVDQGLTSPMLGWAQRYRLEGPAESGRRTYSWVLKLWRNSRLLSRLSVFLRHLVSAVGNCRIGRARRFRPVMTVEPVQWPILPWFSAALLVVVLFFRHALPTLPFDLLESVLTLSHVCGALLISILLWVPLGVALGELSPQERHHVRTAIMPCSVFPAVLLYPVCRLLHLDAAAVLLFLGAHWLVGLAVLDGVEGIPSGLRQVARGLRLRGSLLWRRLLLPAIAPDLCGGLLMAAVPVWNAVMVAEAFVPSDSGLGATLLSEAMLGQVHAQIVALMLLTLLSMLLDRLVLQPLAVHAAQKYAIP
ncbi:ABC transporter permease subunit [Gluconobacter morbifer]|uniref:Transport protein n=1 Tax=Gluconobacter morbifer G707 TaxID=1088869 RepID=G6XI38_9PROT|nr:ABC transporter permease subunit [Gluconobacter morbifer]EHH68478.1 transport protein [Gluconobacter morbifer G707]